MGFHSGLTTYNPRKFIVLKDSELTMAFRMPYKHESTDRIVSPEDSSLNPMEIKMDGVEVYSEFIPDNGTSWEKTMSLAREYGAGFLGFQDWNARNAIVSKVDGKVYIIDTDTDKSFIPWYFSSNNKNRVQDLTTITNIKTQSFDARVREVRIKLDKDRDVGLGI